MTRSSLLHTIKAVACGIIGASIASNAIAQWPPTIPTRPTTFPLQRPTQASEISGWGDYHLRVPDSVAEIRTFVQVACGGWHVLALKSDGTVVAWGSDWSGQSSVPTDLGDVVQIAAGPEHSLALRSDGTVVAWGGYPDPPANLHNVVQIAAGSSFSLALKSDGTVVAWGQSYDPPSDLEDVVQVAAGGSFFGGHALALKSDGTVVAWGSNSSGQASVPDGLSDVVQVAAGGEHSLALRNDGTVVAWGSNLIWEDQWAGQSTVPSNLTGVVQIAAGGFHSLALRYDGSVTGWGEVSAQLSAAEIAPWGMRTIVSHGWHGVRNGLQISAGLFSSFVLGQSHPWIYQFDYATVAWPQNYPFHDTLRAVNGSLPQSWQVLPAQYWQSSGNLPTGISISQDGIISGTPTSAGFFEFTAQVTSPSGLQDQRRLRLRIIPEKASGGGHSFRHLAGTLFGTFTGSDISPVPAGSAAGSGGFSGSADATGGFSFTGSAADAPVAFNSPAGVAVDVEGSVIVSDTLNHVIRKIYADGRVEIIAGSFSGSSDQSLGGVFTGSGTRDDYGLQAEFDTPQGLAIDAAGNIYVAESGSHRIRKVAPSGQVSNFAGSAGFAGSDDGVASDASFNVPTDVAVDAHGNVYVADSANHAIRKIATDGTVTTWAGNPGAAGIVDGTGSEARFHSPQGVAVDADGNVYVADTGNSVIRKISPLQEVVTFAGQAWSGGLSPGYGRASFTGSEHFAYGASPGGVFSARRWGASGPGSQDGTALGLGYGQWTPTSAFSFPTDVEVDSEGDVYVSDSGTSKIRKIASGTVTTIGGSPDGFFYNPLDLAVSPDGVVIVASTADNRIATSFIPVPQLSVETLEGVQITNNGTPQSLGATLAQGGTNQTSFRIRNVGDAELNTIVVTNSGQISGEFFGDYYGSGYNHSSSLAPGAYTDFNVLFAPSDGGARNSQIEITSNDTNNSPFVINLAGFGISADLDSDSDGLNDEAEYRMSALGFDWQQSQPSLVSTLTNSLESAGYYDATQIQMLNVDAHLIPKDPKTSQFEVTIGLSTSRNMQSFQPFSLLGTQTVIEPDGRLRVRFTSPDRAAFFRLQAE